jgi:hypothetical protein
MQSVLLEARVPGPKTSASPFLGNSVLIGFDSEWDSQLPERPLLSVQFAALVGGKMVSRCYDPPGPRMTCDSLLDLVRRFLADVGVEVPVTASRGGVERCHIVLLPHFGAAEVGMFADPLKDLFLQPIGQKGLHASLPTLVRDGVEFHVNLVDTFAFFPFSLKKMGIAVGLEKIEVGSRADLAQLKASDPQLFDRYACRDPEISLAMCTQFRMYVWETWKVDVLTRKSIAAVASEIFQRCYLTQLPAKGREISSVRPSRRKDGTWSKRVCRNVVYGGPVDVRVMAAQSYAGGRAESHIFGLLEGDFVERDVISLYPSAAILQPLPTEKTKWRELAGFLSAADLEGVEGFGCVQFAFPRCTQFPCLPVFQRKAQRMLYPLSGVSNCTVAEMRTALAFGADLKHAKVFVFEPGEAERDHDVGRYMRDLMREKARYDEKTAEYESAKLLMNSLVGKFAERRMPNFLLDFERKARQHGITGAGAIVASCVNLRDSMRGLPMVGSLCMPEQATLILGKARDLMAPFVAKGAEMVSTDSVIIRRGIDMDCDSLRELMSVGSGLTIKCEADAILLVRTRCYFLLQRADNIRLPKGLEKPYAVDETFAVVKVARHGLPVSKEALAETALASIKAKKLIASPLPRVQLLSAVSAVRVGAEVNSEIRSTRMPILRWDDKRVLDKPTVNPFDSWSPTHPVISEPRLTAAEEHGLIVNSNRRRLRRELAHAKRDTVLGLIAAGKSVREISRETGVPRSTIQDLKRNLCAPMTKFLASQQIVVPPDENESGPTGSAP